MEKFTFDSAVRGYHVYKVVWKPTIGEKLQADQELVNEADKFAVKVVKNNEIVRNFLASTRELCARGILSDMAERYVWK